MFSVSVAFEIYVFLGCEQFREEVKLDVALSYWSKKNIGFFWEISQLNAERLSGSLVWFEQKVIVNNFNHAENELEAICSTYFPPLFFCKLRLHLSDAQAWTDLARIKTSSKESLRIKNRIIINIYMFFFLPEINRVRLQLFHHKGNGRIPLELPDPIGPVQTVSEKLYVPVKEHPDVRSCEF